MPGGCSLELVIYHVSATVQSNEWVEVLVHNIFVEGGSWCCSFSNYLLLINIPSPCCGISPFAVIQWHSAVLLSISPGESIRCVQVLNRKLLHIGESPRAVCRGSDSMLPGIRQEYVLLCLGPFDSLTQSWVSYRCTFNTDLLDLAMSKNM